MTCFGRSSSRAFDLPGPDASSALVLPDIVLSKDYPTTRKLMLDELSLEAIDWWPGQAFGGAVIDAATIVGRRGPALDQHVIRVQVHDRKTPSSQQIRQDVFWQSSIRVQRANNDRQRGTWKRLAKYPTLGDVCEIHEGVHSGNIRGELFVDARLDDTCEELIFGRDEIIPACSAGGENMSASARC